MKSLNQRDERERLRRESNRSFILQAAEHVFVRRGFSLATMDAIAAEAQFSKATLYRYFPSKKEIFLQIIINSLDEARRETLQISGKAGGAEDKLREYVRFIMSYSKKKEGFTHIFFMEKYALKKIFNVDLKNFPIHSTKHPEIPTKIKSKMQDISKAVGTIIQEGIDSGEFLDINVKKAVFVLGSLIRGFQFRGPLYDEDISANDSAEIILQFYLNGIKNQSLSTKGV